MIDKGAIKGRGAAAQVPNRFLKQVYTVMHPEGVDPVEEDVVPTKYLFEHPRSILNRVDSPDLPFNWSLNPYQGCEHGCSYCYARPTHEYWGYSAGLDFERVIIVKRNAAELLEQALRHPKWAAEPITLSGATDPYQPVDRTEQLTRRVLQVAQDFRQPVSLITKNALVLRDLDILSGMAAQGLVQVAISLTTLDEELRRVLEPRTSSAANRLRAIRELSAAGVPVMVMVAPIVPALNEPELPALLRAGAEAGARTASYTVLRTNGAVRPVFEQWLRHHFPERASKIIALTNALHGGATDDHVPGRRMKGEGAHAVSIQRLFHVMRRRHFGDRSMPTLVSSSFQRPPKGQLDLFN